MENEKKINFDLRAKSENGAPTSFIISKFNYENVGIKISKLARILGYIFAIVAIVVAVVLLILWLVNLFNRWTAGLAWLYFLYAVISLVAGLLSVLTTWFLYGFGQMVDDMHKIRLEKSGICSEEKNETAHENIPVVKPINTVPVSQSKPIEDPVFVEPEEKKSDDDLYCHYCGKKLPKGAEFCSSCGKKQ